MLPRVGQSEEPFFLHVAPRRCCPLPPSRARAALASTDTSQLMIWKRSVERRNPIEKPARTETLAEEMQEEEYYWLIGKKDSGDDLVLVNFARKGSEVMKGGKLIKDKKGNDMKEEKEKGGEGWSEGDKGGTEGMGKVKRTKRREMN